MTRRTAVILAIGVLAIAGTWLLLGAIARRDGLPDSSTAGGTAASPTAAARKITATLYYVSDDGMSLVGVQREVPFGEDVVNQAREILLAQLGPAPPSLVSAIPAGTMLRTLYITERGDAFVNLSGDARTKHPGGAMNELFTVYTIVDSLTVNLPAITRVQILVEGKEVDTLAGHVDLRHPLQKNLQWVRTEKDESS
jgi:spore germination protein GerM